MTAAAKQHEPHNHAGATCRCLTHPPVDNSLVQTLDEVEFDKGIWSIINRGAPTSKVREFLAKFGSAQQRDWASRKDGSGYTPLHYAVRRPNLETVDLLLSLRADTNAATPSTRMTALHRAAGCGNVAACAVLLAAGADRAARDSRGLTARDWVEQNMFAAAMDRPDAGQDASRVRDELLQMLA